MFWYPLIAVVSLLTTFMLLHFVIPKLKQAGIVGHDVNKEGRPDVAEMGGLTVVAGFTVGLLFALFIHNFFDLDSALDSTEIFVALLTVHLVAYLGIVDDLISIPQWLKAVSPLFVAIPLIVMRTAGSTIIGIPFVGGVDFGIFYFLLLVPLGIAIASNLTNMLAGFNGMEAGMGIVMFATLFVVSLIYSSTVGVILSLAMLGAWLAFSHFNWYPAKVFPGDVGNLTIGAAVATIVILGNFEIVGVFLMIPFVVDFVIKVYNRLPSGNGKWWGELRDGKLYPVDGKVRGFAQLVMKLAGGISEQNLVLFFICLEALVAAIALANTLFF